MATSLVDWTTAFSTATKLVKPGPDITREDAAAVVAELRECAIRAEAYVTEVTGLVAPGSTAPVLVVDRPGWIQANLDGFRQILDPFTDKAEAKLKDASGVSTALGSRITGVEVGALLSYLAPRVLGQFDPFFPTDGRLLLVAPNIVTVERELLVEPRDFRLWVCLHEETHRVQFTAVPWLRGPREGPDRPGRRLGRARPGRGRSDGPRRASSGSWTRSAATRTSRSSTWSRPRPRR